MIARKVEQNPNIFREKGPRTTAFAQQSLFVPAETEELLLCC